MTMECHDCSSYIAIVAMNTSFVYLQGAWMIQACCSIIGLNNRFCNDIKLIRRAVATRQKPFLVVDTQMAEIVLMHGTSMILVTLVYYSSVQV